MIVDGIYVSVWAEREARTACKVNTATGEIFDIESEDNVDDLTHLESEHVEIGCNHQFELEVEDGELTESASEYLFLLHQEKMDEL